MLHNDFTDVFRRMGDGFDKPYNIYEDEGYYPVQLDDLCPYLPTYEPKKQDELPLNIDYSNYESLVVKDHPRPNTLTPSLSSTEEPIMVETKGVNSNMDNFATL